MQEKKKTGFTDEQLTILNISEGKHIVLAVPGTGKTELLTARVVQALNSGIPADEIISLTFTNRAAINMAVRLSDPLLENKIISGTIHNFCYRFLRVNNLTGPELTVLDNTDAEELIEEVKAALGIRWTVKKDDVIQYAMKMRAQFREIPPNLLHFRFSRDSDPRILEKLALKYIELKELDSVFDYNDLLIETYYHLQLTGTGYRLAKFRWLQVDEVQDLNMIQWGIIMNIVDPDGVVVLFGDPGQGIFSFTGARPEILESLEKEFKHHTLSVNFRSEQALITFFDSYRESYLSKKSFLLSGIDSPETASSYNGLAVYTRNDQAVRAFGFPEEFLEQGSVIDNGGSTAVLVRKNIYAENLYNFFRSKRVDCFKVSGTDLFERAFMKDSIAFLGTLSYVFNAASWKRILRLFGGFRTLRAAAQFVRELKDHSLNPGHLLNGTDSSLFLREFLESFRNGRVIVFDTETTGLDTSSDDIIQIAAVEYIKGVRGREFEVFLKSEKENFDDYGISGITAEFLRKNGKDPLSGLRAFLDFCGRDPLAAHNSRFDSGMLASALKRNGLPPAQNRIFDTLAMARFLYPGARNYKLSTLISELSLSGENTHNALDDVKATGSLIERISADSDAALLNFEKFREANQKVFANLEKSYGSFYREHMAKSNGHSDLRHLIRDFLSLRASVTGTELNEDELTGLQKFERFLEIKIGAGKLDTLLKKHLTSLMKFRESDLLIGDERFVISTIHKAKGLEFENVVIPFCTSDSFRHNVYTPLNQIQEDAKLLYVGMTRAKKNLILVTPGPTALPRYIDDHLFCFYNMK